MRIKTFNTILAEELTLEGKGGRAWGGKLKEIDNLLMWMYEKDILTASEKNQKDKLFHKYYRYFNDGEWPSGLKTPTGGKLYKPQTMGKYGRFSADDEKIVQDALEEMLNSFIRKILSKYWKKIDRGAFRIDQKIKELDDAIKASESSSPSSLNYWKKGVSDPKALESINKVIKMGEDLKIKISKIDNSKSNYTISYQRDKMKEEKTWTPELEKDFKAIQVEMININALLMNLKISLTKIKKLHDLG